MWQNYEVFRIQSIIKLQFSNLVHGDRATLPHHEALSELGKRYTDLTMDAGQKEANITDTYIMGLNNVLWYLTHSIYC